MYTYTYYYSYKSSNLILIGKPSETIIIICYLLNFGICIDILATWAKIVKIITILKFAILDLGKQRLFLRLSI